MSEEDLMVQAMKDMNNGKMTACYGLFRRIPLLRAANPALSVACPVFYRVVAH